jgi:hypothetical protein
MEPYEIDVKFVNNDIIGLSDEQMIKIKVVDLEKLYNFVVDNFFYFEIILPTKTTFEFLKFEIQIIW